MQNDIQQFKQYADASIKSRTGAQTMLNQQSGTITKDALRQSKTVLSRKASKMGQSTTIHIQEESNKETKKNEKSMMTIDESAAHLVANFKVFQSQVKTLDIA